jgi:hypothetical protein
MKWRKFCHQFFYVGSEKPIDSSALLGRDAWVNVPEITVLINIVRQARGHNRRGQAERSEDARGPHAMRNEGFSRRLKTTTKGRPLPHKHCAPSSDRRPNNRFAEAR